MKKVRSGTKCPNDNKISISSLKCQKCANYIKHKLICDDHGRIDDIHIDCNVINCEQVKQI